MKPSNKIGLVIIIPGGIGTGINNVGVPVLDRLVRLLSEKFDVTVYSLFKVNAGFVPSNFELFSITGPNLFIRFCKLAIELRKLRKRKNFHIIHGFWALPSGLMAVVLAKVFNVKSMISILGGDATFLPEINYGQLKTWLHRKLIFASLRHADEVISLTRYLVQNLKAAGFDRPDIKIIPWGIETEIFTFHQQPIHDVVQFLHIANLHPVKDQETLLRTFRSIRERRPSYLTMIGQGVDLGKVQQFIKTLDLQDSVTLVDQVPYESLPGYYHRSDVLLHTSLSEGQSEVVTEAMSSGVVVCGTSVGLMFDEPGCCLSVPTKDFQKLADITLDMLNNPAQFNQIRNKAHAWASNHSIHWTANQMADLYKNLTE